MTYRAALSAARASLEDAGVGSAALDARLLLAAAADLDMAALVARNGDELASVAEQKFNAYLKRRLTGEPVARILGGREFWGLPFEVGPATLTPRPETEILVEAVISEARRRPPRNLRICDLGVGSGAIIVALCVELPAARGTASDISADALRVARRNAERLGVAERIRFVQVGFKAGPDGPFDVVVSNPPYVRSGEIAGLERDVRDFDPYLALDGGPDGLAAYRTILARVPSLLAGGGLLAFEVGQGQAEEVAALCRESSLADLRIVSDLAGISRVVLARRHDTPL